MIYIITLPHTAHGNLKPRKSFSPPSSPTPKARSTTLVQKYSEIVHVPLRFFPHKIGHIQNSFPQMTFFPSRNPISNASVTSDVTYFSFPSLDTSLTRLLLMTVPLRTRSAQSAYRTDGRQEINKCTFLYDLTLRQVLHWSKTSAVTIRASAPRAAHA